MKKTIADGRYVHTIEYLEPPAYDVSAYQEGEYQRLTADDKIQHIRHTIEPYPHDITLVQELGNDNIKMKTWLIPGKKGVVCTVTRRIALKEISCVKMDSGVSFIAVKGEIHELNKMVDRLWFYETHDRFICIPHQEEAGGKIAIDDNSIVKYCWQTTDEDHAKAKLQELQELLTSGQATFLFGNQDPVTRVVTISDGRVINMDKTNLTPPADFDCAFYVREYPDVAAHPYFRSHPYEHYVYCGRTEKRKTH